MTEFFVHNAWLVPLLPLIGGVIAAVGGRWLKGNSHIPVIAGIALAFLVSLVLLTGASGHSSPTVFEWIEVSGLSVPFQFRVDGLTTMMLSMVTFVATLVAVFASGYMSGDPGYPRFFSIVGLFVASMTGLVLSSHFVLTYVFWEGVGVCSYLLVGFWYQKPSAAAAAKKAFLVNRIGDVGFAIALFWLWSVCQNHDLSYDNVFSETNLRLLHHHDFVGICLLLFWAATAKSAQVPLYVWLPDAMEGPTPVSALIHAATMVTAGVYLIARSTPLIVHAPEVQAIVAVIGCVTALLAALIALTQNDLKRVMAYSTVSQLGFMFMGLGAGVGKLAAFAVIGAMFHLFTHAFFKALLFLASGSVMHAMGGVIDMRRFGGLRKRMPITCITFALGALALMGIPPFAGFFSKDEILSSLHLASLESEAAGGIYPTLYVVVYWTAIATAALTAYYTGRAFFLTFFGPERLPSPDDPEAEPADAHGHGHGDGHDSHFGHEVAPVMWIPLAILAFCAVTVGALFGLTGWFAHLLEHTRGLAEAEGAHHAFDWFTATVSTSGALLALALSYVFYGMRSPMPANLATQLKPLYLTSLHKFYVDEIYERIVIWPTKFLAATAEFLDIVVVDNLVRLTAWLPRVFGRYVLGPFQNGLIQYYAAVTALSVAGLLFVFLWMSAS